MTPEQALVKLLDARGILYELEVIPRYPSGVKILDTTRIPYGATIM